MGFAAGGDLYTMISRPTAEATIAFGNLYGLGILAGTWPPMLNDIIGFGLPTAAGR
jgi:hypothetical protein